MKKLFCLILFTLFLYIQGSHPILAEYYSKYLRYSTNGLLVPETPNWDSNKIQYPDVIFDNGLYKMWYSGHNGTYWSVGYALSLDGINWYKYPNNPVLTWDKNETHPKHIITPSVIKDDNIYRMWFTSSYTDLNDYDFTIGYATSSDGINWKIGDYDQLSPSQSWDTIGLTHPFTLKKGDSDYYLYYSARNTTNWNIGYATSSDGINWKPYSENPIISTTGKWWEKGSNLGPFVIYDNVNNLFKMWYSTESLGQGSSSMAYAESSNLNTWVKPDSANPVLNRELTGYFDDRIISDGSVYIVGNSILLWYSGKASDGKWRIGLSYYGDLPIPIPTPSYSLFPTTTPIVTNTPTETPTPTLTSTPTLTPTPTSTPTPTPTPTPLPPVVIIPGMFSSWNKEALLEKMTSQTAWSLLPFVKEYSGLIQTLKKLGYTENQNLFLWPYDWRQQITTTSDQLNNFLNTAVFPFHPNTKINLVGHSLGGLIARTWAQANPTKVNHLITVGSPNQGVVQPYRAWEGGNITQDNTFLTLLATLLVKIQKTSLQTNREIVQKTFPVLRDLLPTSPYLIKASDNTEIPKSSMQIWNTYLTELNTQSSSIYSIFNAITGTGVSTPYKYKVETPSKLDILLGNWIDGKPTETIYETGDGTVVESRAAFTDDQSYSLDKDHGTLIASKEGINKILELFSIDHSTSDITEGTITSLAPGMLFLLRSPATLQVTDDQNHSYVEQDGFLLIPNAVSGSYHAKITGTSNGIYHLMIGQFTATESAWMELTNTISTGATQQYDIAFNSQKPLDVPITSMSLADWLGQIDAQLQQLTLPTKTIQRLRIHIAIAKQHIQKRQLFIIKIQLEQLLQQLSDIRRRTTSMDVLQQTIDVGETIQSVYSVYITQHLFFPNHVRKNQHDLSDQDNIQTNRFIDERQKKKLPSTRQLLLLQEAENNSMIAQTALNNKEFAKAYIYFFQSHLLYQEALHP